MSKVLLLFDKDSVTNGYSDPEELANILKSDINEYTILYLEDLIFDLWQEPKVYDSITDTDIASFDVVYFRRWMNKSRLAMAAAIYLESKKVVFYDREVLGIGSQNKLTQMYRLWANNLPIPKTLSSGGSKIANKKILNIVDDYIDINKSPVIVKATNGTRGSDNFLVTNEADLENILEDDNTYLIQEFIENNGDLRIFVTDNTAELIISRMRTQGHLNNTSMGAKSELIDKNSIDKNIINDSIKASKVMERQITGVDIIVSSKDTNKYYILEVNRAPQVEKSTYTNEKSNTLNKLFSKSNKVDENGFITMIVMMLIILGVVIFFAYKNVVSR